MVINNTQNVYVFGLYNSPLVNSFIIFLCTIQQFWCSIPSANDMAIAHHLQTKNMGTVLKIDVQINTPSYILFIPSIEKWNLDIQSSIIL